MINNPPKISSTAYRILLILKLLYNKNLSFNDINNIFLNDELINRTYTKEGFLKYIRTLNKLNCTISKINNKRRIYKLDNTLQEIELDKKTIQSLVILKRYSINSDNSIYINIFNSLLEKLYKYISAADMDLLIKNNKQFKDSIFSNILLDKHKKYIAKIKKNYINKNILSIKYQQSDSVNSKQLVLEQEEIKFHQNNLYLIGFNPISLEKLSLNFDYIKEIDFLATQYISTKITSNIIFKLKGKLAKNYDLYPNEKIISIDKNEKSITIKNQAESPDIIANRLLKYAELCEIIYPKSFKKQLLDTAHNALVMYNTN